MKQILQSLKNGNIEIADVPAPDANKGNNLIRTSTSLVSAGTERMLLEFGKSNLLQKAKRHPDRVRMVLDKAKTDGIFSTMEAVQSKLDQPLALGYCNVGTVIEGFGTKYNNGDRVVSNGKHAEIVSVPQNLCAKIPDNVTDEAASFTVLASIGLQGIRLAKPTLGEAFVVIGLGLIGLLTVQMLRAHGCRVLGIDLDPARLELARSFGVETVSPVAGENILSRASKFTHGVGVDAVIITASTSSNEPISQAAKMCRKRGRIILVGVAGLELRRADFYEKELSFQVSCSYGPGRYEDDYEIKGVDYPPGFVRWTEQRNFEAVLGLMASGDLKVDSLISHRFEISEGKKAFELLGSDEPYLGILISYLNDDSAGNMDKQVSLQEYRSEAIEQNNAGVAFIGAGNYASRVLIPSFKANGANLRSIVSVGGVSSIHFGKKFGFLTASTDYTSVLADEETDTIVVATRHDSHAFHVLSALEANKHVFCEKPLCLTSQDLADIMSMASKHPSKQLMVGFNRRFAPHTIKIKELLAVVDQPKSVIITINAGFIPGNHWTQDHEVGGGRVVGECCHFIDLARHIIGSRIKSHNVVLLGGKSETNITNDNLTINLEFDDGSFAAIHYLANGHKGFPKERVEVFVAGRILQLDNFISLRGWGWPGFKSMRLWRQNKGQRSCVLAFLNAVKGAAASPIPKEEIFEVSKISIEAAEAARTT